MKKPPPGTEELVAKMTFALVYPLYLAKVEKKGRTKEELLEVIEWLTGCDEKSLLARQAGRWVGEGTWDGKDDACSVART